MSRATFPDKLRTQMRMALPMIDKNIRCKANTSRQSLMQASGLNDNQLQAALRMAYGEKGVPSPVYRSPTAGKMYEVLNYPDESRRMLMQGFADKVDRIASNNRRTDIELFQVCRALGEPNVPALLSLCDDGLPAYKAGAWRIDCRSFRKWATAYTPYRPQTKPQTAYEGEPLF